MTDLERVANAFRTYNVCFVENNTEHWWEIQPYETTECLKRFAPQDADDADRECRLMNARAAIEVLTEPSEHLEGVGRSLLRDLRDADSKQCPVRPVFVAMLRHMCGYGPPCAKCIPSIS